MLERRNACCWGKVLLLCAIMMVGLQASVQSEPSGKLIMFHAGSLSVPFAKMEKELESKYPKLDIQREAAGSRKCARKITDDKRTCDIMASADYKVIDNLLIPEYADWNVRFASNQLVLCYTSDSARANKINKKNWPKILMQKDVSWGHTDPNLDPCGYRALMVLQLAERHLEKPGLVDKLIANRHDENVFPKASGLIAHLQNGKLDYGWEYLSVAVQHNLNYIPLPDEINLGNYKHDSNYRNAVVKVTGKEPGTFLELKGKSITYGVTILKDAPNKEAAIAFLEYLLDPEGGIKVLKEMGQPPFSPGRIPTEEMMTALPAELGKLVEVRP
ncbi:tungstate ABC transporter substrate-binding protein WtpA [Acidobacteriota bacterium]